MQTKEQASQSLKAKSNYKRFHDADLFMELCRGTTINASEFFYMGDHPFWSDTCEGWIRGKLNKEPVCPSCLPLKREREKQIKAAEPKKRAYKKKTKKDVLS